MRYMDLDIDTLRSFVTISESGGFTAAGDLLGRTQSAMSVKIKKLEDSLGHRLFERTSRSLSLTGDGELLLAYARRILELNDEAVSRFMAPEMEGDLRLGIGEYFVPHHLPALLRQFARVFPRVHVEVKVALGHVLLAALDQGELDVVICCKHSRTPVDGRVIWVEPLSWIGSDDWTLARDVPIPLCSLPPPCIFRERTLEALERAGLSWRSVFTSESMMSVEAAAAAGLGLAVLGQSTLGPEIRRLGPGDGLPALGSVEIAIFGETASRRKLIEPFEQMLIGGLEQGTLRRAG